MKLWKNKLFGIGLIALGIAFAVLLQEGTGLVLCLLFGIALLFAKENWID